MSADPVHVAAPHVWVDVDVDDPPCPACGREIDLGPGGQLPAGFAEGEAVTCEHCGAVAVIVTTVLVRLELR